MSPAIARKTTFADPSICDSCGAVYTGKTWRRGRRLSAELANRAQWVRCPGCRQAKSGEYYGRVLIEVGDGVARDAILTRIGNVERRAQFTQPQRRIVSTAWDGPTLEVLTTSQKLAHRIVREVEKLFGGKPRFAWSDQDGSLFATLKIPSRTPARRRSR